MRVDGRPFADSLPVSGRGTVLYPPALTARGLPAPVTVWTGTNADGAAAAENCSLWSGTGTGVAGTSWGGSFRWTADGDRDCSGAPAALVCLGTTHSNPLSIPPPPPGARMIFVTRQVYGITGGAAANDLCQMEASGFLSGTWTAVLAQGTNPGAFALPNTQEPLYRPDGVLVALHSADLRNGVAFPLAPIEVTADGQHVDDLVWTGSYGPLDASSGKNCDDWMMNSSMAIVGNSAVAGDRWWASGSNLLSCGSMARL